MATRPKLLYFLYDSNDEVINYIMDSGCGSVGRASLFMPQIRSLILIVGKKNYTEGSGCGAVGRAVASNSSHRQKFMEHLLSTVLKRRK